MQSGNCFILIYQYSMSKIDQKLYVYLSVMLFGLDSRKQDDL